MNIITYTCNFVSQYWSSILVAIFFILFLLTLIKRGKTDYVKHLIFIAVVKAEKTFGSKTGPMKYSEVVVAIYDKLPLILRILFTKQDINNLIEEAVSKLKELLKSDDVNLLTYSMTYEDY